MTAKDKVVVDRNLIFTHACGVCSKRSQRMHNRVTTHRDTTIQNACSTHRTTRAERHVASIANQKALPATYKVSLLTVPPPPESHASGLGI